MKDKENPCPSGSGTSKGWEVQYQNEDKVWKTLNHEPTECLQCGIPGPEYRCKGQYLAGKLSYVEAMALAWKVKAGSSFMSGIRSIRVVPFDIKFSYGAFKKEDEAEELDFTPLGIKVKQAEK